MSARVEEGVAVFGDEAEQQSIDEAQKCPQVFPVGYCTGAQSGDKPGVVRVVQETVTEFGESRLHADSELVQGAGTSCHGVGAPHFQPAVGRAGVLSAALLCPRGVRNFEEQQELWIEITVEYRLQVELQIR